MRFAEFVYYFHYCNRGIPMDGFDEKEWRELCFAYGRNTDLSKHFADEPVSFEMSYTQKRDLVAWVCENLIPYMTLKHPNKKHSAYRLKHIAEKEIGRYVCAGELQAVLARIGFPPNDYYPISEKFFGGR